MPAMCNISSVRHLLTKKNDSSSRLSMSLIIFK